MSDYEIHPITDDQRTTVREMLTRYWGSTRMVTRGRLLDVSALPGFIAWRGAEPLGLITYEVVGAACEIAVLESLEAGIGIGSALIGAVKAVAHQRGCSRLWLITTNDNTHALRFYQKRGFRLVALHCNALEQSRRLKPEISMIGMDGIPLRDEIELETEL